jgi:hypothetical protein
MISGPPAGRRMWLETLRNRIPAVDDIASEKSLRACVYVCMHACMYACLTPSRFCDRMAQCALAYMYVYLPLVDNGAQLTCMYICHCTDNGVYNSKLTKVYIK